MREPLLSNSAIRYIPVGFSAFLIDWGLLRVGLHFGLPLLLANGISAGVAIVYGYFIHRRFTFVRQARAGYKISAQSQFVSFVTVSVIGLGLNELLMELLVVNFHLDTNLSKIMTAALVFIWNYLANRALTFRSVKG